VTSLSLPRKPGLIRRRLICGSCLVAGELATPDTWEVALSAGASVDKREAWERLLAENKLGAQALLRNLRNMAEPGWTSSWSALGLVA